MRRTSSSTVCVAAALLLAACASSSKPSGSGSGSAGATSGNGNADNGNADNSGGGGTPGAGPGGGGGSGGGTGSGGSGGAFSGNPFAGARFYVNPDYVAEVQKSIDANPASATQLRKLQTISTAIWLDSIATVASAGKYLDDALAQQQAAGQPVITLFVIYDLPGRDCHANASNGELTLSATDVARYKRDYIDAIAAAFAAHAGQRIAAVVEPDSLPNIATNLSDPRCAAAEQTYRDSVAYAIGKLSAPHVALYLDAAHSGWLGWPDNTTKAATIFSQVLTAAGGADKIRGFATNTANYTVLHETAELYDYQSNPCHDELTYVQHLTAALAGVGISQKGFVIDTSRNGKGGIRATWGSWCNVHGAAIGERPAADPVAGVDAYLWVKPPGESDGTADASAPRFDAACGSGNADATPGAPQAGQWFPSYLLTLAANATPPL